jgi:hypothetical protein
MIEMTTSNSIRVNAASLLRRDLMCFMGFEVIVWVEFLAGTTWWRDSDGSSPVFAFFT